MNLRLLVGWQSRGGVSRNSSLISTALQKHKLLGGDLAYGHSLKKHKKGPVNMGETHGQDLCGFANFNE